MDGQSTRACLSLFNEKVVVQTGHVHVLRTLQEVELHVPVDEDETKYDLEVDSRVYVRVPKEAFMAFTPEEVDSTPLLD